MTEITGNTITCFTTSYPVIGYITVLILVKCRLFDASDGIINTSKCFVYGIFGDINDTDCSL